MLSGLFCVLVATPAFGEVKTETVPVILAQDKSQDLPSARVDQKSVDGAATERTLSERAGASSPDLASARAEVEKANADRSQALSLWVPSLTLSARYLRLSDFTMPTFGSGSLVGTQAAPGTLNPPSSALPPIRFPNLLNQTRFAAELGIPVSDYFLRVPHAVRAASRAEDAAAANVRGQAREIRLQANLAYYQWLAAHASVRALTRASESQRARLSDIEKLEKAGAASLADTLSARAEVARVQAARVQAEGLVERASIQLETLTHAAAPEAPQDILGALEQDGDRSFDLKSAQDVALAEREELKALGHASSAQEEKIAVERALYWPSLTLLGSLEASNPNARVQPARDVFTPTWAVGAELRIRSSDLLSAGSRVDREKAALSQLQAHRMKAQDGIRQQVADAHIDARTQEAALKSARERKVAADEALRVGESLFRAERINATRLLELQSQSEQADLGVIDALAKLRAARAKLQFAIGK
jgi:outer membrane protein TolC